MPGKKRQISEESEAREESEREEVEEKPAPKKTKTEKSKPVSKKMSKVRIDSDEDVGSGSTKVKANEQGEKYVQLGTKRRVTVRSFNGKPMVDIREFYEKDGKELPGKKGISLSAEQWQAFKDSIATIDELFQAMK
ncbi:hypothetical protein FRC03_012885 [Tulasnella sp. 419]|nr:hypothetical protein FRC02_000399 [Tulasnella sp. 418]KAG8965857.1 hypothetical protein FRC03_012885 [Tulasnella sp. 419]